MPKDFAASYWPRGKACNPPLITSATYAASNNEIAMITLTSLSINISSGKNIGNITEDMNNTVIRGTPLQNSIMPIDIYLIIGKSDLLPKDKKSPTGKQNIKQKNDTINVNDSPPQAPVSTQVRASNFPNSKSSS